MNTAVAGGQFQIAGTDRKRVLRAWEAFVSGSSVSLDCVPRPIQESWERSRARGIDPLLPCAPTDELFPAGEALRRQYFWLSAAETVFEQLRAVFEEKHQLLLLSDAAGRVLLSHGGSAALPRAEELHAVAGGYWGEAAVGCTAIGASLATGTAVQTSWFENYCQNWHDWVNQAAPISDPITGEVLGAINVGGFREISHPGTLELLRQAVSFVRMAVAELEAKRRVAVLERYGNSLPQYPADGLVALDWRGHLLALNSPAERQLAIRANDYLGRRVEQIGPLLDALGPDAAQLMEIGRAGRPLPDGVRFICPERQDAGVIVVLPTRARKPSSDWNTRYSLRDLVGDSETFRRCLDVARKASVQPWPLLLLGESGTGKELFAHAIHNAGPRCNAPFVSFACAGVSDELIGAELFGYTGGSFTGAAKGGNRGKVSLAHRGTLFLDDIDCMPVRMQASLLRVIEDGLVVPVGGTKPEPVDIRLIASTNADLEAGCVAGWFRHDLFHRINVLSLQLPALRDRPDDLPILARHLLDKFVHGTSIDEDALEMLARYRWPGNVRELRNVLLRASLVCQEGRISGHDVSGILSPLAAPLVDAAPTKEDSDLGADRANLISVLKSTGSVMQAADHLGVHFTTLYRWLRRHKIDPKAILKPALH